MSQNDSFTTIAKMDSKRKDDVAYQYLCHLEEAKKWMEACLEEVLPEADELETQLQHGVYLAKLAHFFAPETVPFRKIFDPNLTKYNSNGLHFRHTDNINYFLKAIKAVNLPSIFYPETTDIYDKKNMPRAIFCIHALSLYLFRLGIAPQIQDLYGKIKFSDEVVNTMMQELNKYGCQLPQFGKIGGILANELPVDEAALHAAVIAINEAIDREEINELYQTLINPTCHLKNVLEINNELYLERLSQARNHKKEIAVNKSREPDYIPDAYDELLTQAEIQGHVNYANIVCAIDAIENAIIEADLVKLKVTLSSNILNFKGILPNLLNEYMTLLKDEMDSRDGEVLNQSMMPCSLSKTSIQQIIMSVNHSDKEKKEENEAVKMVNKCLSGDSPIATLQSLKKLQSKLVNLVDYAAPLYHTEMASIKVDAQNDLTLEEIQGGVRLLSAIGRINAAVQTGNLQEVWHYLVDPHAHLQNLDERFQSDYYSAINAQIQSRAAVPNVNCYFLTYFELQALIDEVNEDKNWECEKIDIMNKINEDLKFGNVTGVLSSLKNNIFQLQNDLQDNDAVHIIKLLHVVKNAKCQLLDDEDAELWLEDVTDVVEAAHRHFKEASTIASVLSGINKSLENHDHKTLSDLLRKDFLELRIDDDMNEVINEVQKIYKHKKQQQSKLVSPWFGTTISDGSPLFINTMTGNYQWHEPSDLHNTKCGGYLTISEIRDIVGELMYKKANHQTIEAIIIRLQARIRGALVRDSVCKKKMAAVMLQAWWRMIRMQKMYTSYRNALKAWEPYIIVIQRAVRQWLQKRRINELCLYFKKNEMQVIIIQRAWRKHKAKRNLRALTHCENPSLGVLRQFIHLLEVSSDDFNEELRLMKIKSDIVKAIRSTQDLENKVDELDLKIGLLVHNRITLQDVLPDKENVNPNIMEGSSKKNKKSNKDLERCGTLRAPKGLKALKKQSRERLLGYQHLFYLLQTDPRYLASLIFALPPSKTTKFIENVIFTLYNYGTNDRDHYLLLKLFKTALEEEIRCKVLRLSDIVTGNPLVLKMIVSFNRKGAGQASLRDMLGPLIKNVLIDTNLRINTNPVEIYRTWVNQLEMHSGKPSGMAYVVSQEEALSYQEVQKRLNLAIESLKQTTAAFCDQITSNWTMIPYAMLYMAKTMKQALHKRFPHIPSKEILKVVGNLVYYRYINSAIVAPDAFDIVSVSPEDKLNNEQRRNLASIAKILQFAASKKGFGEESSHLTCLNPFIIECHEKFKTFFQQCCQVEDPEDIYNVNQYSEATLIIKPTIYISLQEICETHELLLDHEDILATEGDDPLHQLLSDLGDRPSVLALIREPGVISAHDEMENEKVIGKTEICLALTNKFSFHEDSSDKKNKDSGQKLFTKTKQLLVDVLRCVEGDNVQGLSIGATLPRQETNYRSIIETRTMQERQAKLNHTSLNRSNSFLADTRVSLHEAKTKLNHNLRRLENQGLAVRADNYQALLTAIAVDIVNQRQHRISRINEIQKLSLTLSQLETKEMYFEEQLDSFNTYMHTCLKNIAARNKNVHQSLNKGNGKKIKSKSTLKYTAARLHEKGVLIEIEDLQESQLKNIMFEITPLASTGIFQVQVKFVGVAMEIFQLDIQELLQLQYEGVIVKKMMGEAKVNVNMLLHLLNSKFYSKKK